MKRPFFDFLRKRLLFLFYIFLFIDIVHAQDGHTSFVDSIVMLHHDHVNDINENVSVMVMDVDTIRDDVSSIHDEVKTLTNDVNTYFNDNVGCCNWNMVGAIGSILGVIAMIIVYCLTRKKTNEQIKSNKETTDKQLEAQKEATKEQITAQYENTKNQIEEQRRLSSEQIKAMQDQALLRTQSLEQMGKIIEKHTGEIQTSVKHFEDKYLASNDRTEVEDALSEMKALYDQMCNRLNVDYDHFDDESKNEGTNKDFYEESCTSIKKYAEKIHNVLSKYTDVIQVPEDNPYLDALYEVIFKPSFLHMDEQKGEFTQKGEDYHNAVKSIVILLFQ
ncbi:MAG: hypothetical protein J6P65_06020 [Bacteroidales bacterium]|nr:hypothetical protein [Bacteroidales bacterium]